MIRAIAFAIAAGALCAGATAAQPYGQPDPYGMPPGYTTGEVDPYYAYSDEDYADPADAPPAYYESGSEYEAPDPYDGYREASRYEGPYYAAEPYPRPHGDRGDVYYNSGGYVDRSYSARGGSAYSSRSSTSSRSAYVGGAYVDESPYSDRDPGYARSYSDEHAYSDGYRGGYGSGDYGYEIDTRYAPFAYQRRFYAYSVAEGRAESTSWSRREEYAYIRRHRLDDLRLPASFFMGGLTGGVEGEGPVMWSSGGGGNATASASASAGARAGAFAGARGGRRGHEGGGCGRC